MDDVWFQQGGAPAHCSLMVRAELDRKFPNRWIGRGGPIAWPAQSPDFAPLDYFGWGYMTQRIFPSRPETPQQLKDNLTEFFRNQNTQLMMENVREGFNIRLYHCLQENGGQFEHLV
jgi:hypothetical protein